MRAGSPERDADMDDTRQLPPAGWYADVVDDSPEPRLRWWDGANWTPVTVSRASIERRVQVPSRAAVIGLFSVATLLVAVTLLATASAYGALERGCRDTSPGAVDACVSDTAFGVDMIAMLVLIVAAVVYACGFVALGRRAHRSAASPPVGRDEHPTT